MSNMNEFDMEEAHYYWVINEICDLVRQYGYSRVMSDIDKSLTDEDVLTVSVDKDVKV